MTSNNYKVHHTLCREADLRKDGTVGVNDLSKKVATDWRVDLDLAYRMVAQALKDDIIRIGGIIGKPPGQIEFYYPWNRDEW